MLPFNVDGPMPVSEAGLLHYQENPPKSFEHAYYAWINENNDAEYRRLCLRDMLRQWHTTQQLSLLESRLNSEHALHDYSLNFVSITTIQRDFYWVLRNRPQLLKEIVEEWLYILQHNYIPLCASSCEHRDRLTEFLVNLCDEETSRLIWAYHTLNAPVTFFYDKVSKRLELWSSKYPPAWLHTELWRELEDWVERQVQRTLSRTSPDIPISLFDDTDDTYGFKRLIDHLRPDAADSGFALVSAIIRLLESHLPAHVTYLKPSLLPYCTNPKCALDESVIISCTQRHLGKIDVATNGYCLTSPNGRHFLYWARGIIGRSSPSNEDMITKIDQLLDLDLLPASCTA